MLRIYLPLIILFSVSFTIAFQLRKNSISLCNSKLNSRFKLNTKSTKSKGEAFFEEEENLDNNDNTDAKLSSTSDKITQAKLKAEAAAPFRLLRQFIFAGMIGAGGLATITTIPQLILSGEIERNTVLENLAIDLAGLVGGAFLLKFEIDRGNESIENFTAVENKRSNQLTANEVVKRQELIGKLPVEIQINEQNENVTRIVSLKELQEKAQQQIVIVAGEKDFVQNTIIGARAEGREMFTRAGKETIIVPFCLDDIQFTDDKSKGFGNKTPLMSASYIAKPKQLEIWGRILELEFQLAENQGTKKIRSKGLVLGINKSGKIVRRGVGYPPWKELIESIK